MELLKVLGVLVILIARCGTEPYEVDNLHETLEGTWDWSGDGGMCTTGNPHTISFDSARGRMTLTYARPFDGSNGIKDSIWVYDVLSATRSTLSTFMHGENRRDDAGNLVKWDMVLITPDEYRWRRGDWHAWQFSEPFRRCPD